jgi:epoxyqueuosine reductase QueG
MSKENIIKWFKEIIYEKIDLVAVNHMTDEKRKLISSDENIDNDLEGLVLDKCIE